MAYTDGNIIIGTTVDMKGMNTGLKKIQNSLKQISYLTGAAFGVAGLVKFGKAALDAASDLQEVQNIVDVSFGEMSWMVDKFAATCVEKFGISELAAKQTAGSFMAMGKSMGLSMDEASEMAIKLTGLTGDFASFYNISQEYARVALAAVYTGETETLKRYGIVLTEANLQQYAYTQGIDKSVKKMDAREKALLRYQYILKATADMEGDFIRTSQTWANQVRVLQQRWNQFLVTMGNGLKNVFAPVLRGLNKILKYAIKFANTLGSILARLFGAQWKPIAFDWQSGNEGIADSADDAADAEEDLGDSAKKAGKDAKKSLAPWDDLNVLQQDLADSAGDAGKALGDIGADGAGGDAATGGGFDYDFKDWLPDINDLFELGRWLSNKLAEMLEGIDWAKVYLGARNFGSGLAHFLNGLITPRLFSDVGSTIAKALNAALYSALTFGKQFDWKNLGNSIAAGINAFFRDFDFNLLAKTINVWAKGLLTTILQVLKKTDWKMIGKQIGTLLKSIDWLGIMKKVAQVIWEALNAAIKLFRGMFETAPFETVILGIVGLFAFLNSDIAKSLGAAIKTIDLFTTALVGGAGNKGVKALKELRQEHTLLAGVVDVIDILRVSWDDMITVIRNGSGVFAGLKTFFSDISSALTVTQKAVIGVVAAIGEFLLIKSAVEDITLAVKNGTGAWQDFAFWIGEIIVAFGLAGVAFSAVFGFPAGLIAAALVGIIAAFVGLKSAIDEINEQSYVEAFGRMIEATENGTHTLSDYKQEMNLTVDRVTAGLTEMKNSFTQLADARTEVQETTAKIETIATIMATTRYLTEDEISKLNASFESLAQTLVDTIGKEYDAIMQQEIVDRSYLKSIGEWSEADEQAFQQHITQLQLQKEGDMEAAQTVVDAAQQETAALSEVYQQYADGKIGIEEYQQKVSEYANTLEPLLTLEEKHGLVENELATKVGEASSAFEKYSGQLNLSGQDINEINDLQTQVKATVEGMRSTYDEAALAIAEDSKDYIASLDNMNLSESERESMLTKHKATVEARLKDLSTTYTTNLSNIQADLTNLVPTAMEEMGKRWDDMNWIERAFCGYTTKDEFIKGETERFVADLYSPDGYLGETLEEAFKQVGVEGGNWAEDASQDMINSMFTATETEFRNGVKVTEPELKEEYKGMFDNTAEFVENAIDDYDVAGKFNEKAKETIDGYNSGIDEYGDTTKDKLLGWIDKIVSWVHDSSLNFGSPSKTMIDFGDDTVKGYNQGIENNSGTTQGVITKWLSGITSLFTPFITAIGTQFKQLPTAIQTAFSTLGSWFDTNVIQPLKTKFTTLTTNIAKFFTDLWATISTLWATVTTWFDVNVIQPVFNLFNTLTKNVNKFFTDLWTGISNLWKTVSTWFDTTVIQPTKKLFDALCKDVDNFFSTLWANISKLWSTVATWFDVNVIQPVRKLFDTLCRDVANFFSTCWTTISQLWSTVANWFTQNVINPVRSAFETLTNTVSGYWDSLWKGIKDGAKTAFNGVIAAVEGGINNIIDKVNSFIETLNTGLSTLAGIAGLSIGSIPTFERISIPRLATGAVIPPNAPFVAMLGDQRSGTNIEAPLDTIIQAMTQALQSMNIMGTNQQINLTIDGETLARLTVPHNLNEMHRLGYNVNVLEG